MSTPAPSARYFGPGPFAPGVQEALRLLGHLAIEAPASSMAEFTSRMEAFHLVANSHAELLEALKAAYAVLPTGTALGMAEAAIRNAEGGAQ